MNCKSRRAKVSHLGALILTLFTAVAHGAFIETFSNGSDDGNWHLTDNPDRLLRIESGGGNPGAYLHGQVFTPVPVWYVPLGTSPTHFLGNYSAQGIGRIGFDLDIFSGTEAPSRAITLDLLTTLGTGDFSQGLEAYRIGRDISTLPVGWKTYSLPYPPPPVQFHRVGCSCMATGHREQMPIGSG